jgi:hypothetical protein
MQGHFRINVARRKNDYRLLAKRRAWFDDEPREEEIDTGPENNTIDWNNINLDDIPDEVVSKLPSYRLKANEAYSQALEEAITRRQTISELKQQLDGNDNDEVEQPDNSDPAISQIMKELEGLKSLIAQDKRQTLVQEIASKYKLNQEAASLLSGEDREALETQAKTLAKLSGHKFEDNTGTGGGSKADAQKALRDRLVKRMRGEVDENASIFDSRTHQRKGGGAL